MTLTAQDYVNLVDQSTTGTGKGQKDPPDTGGLSGLLSSTGGKLLGAGIGALLGGFGSGAQTQGSQGYAGGIPSYSAERTPLTYTDTYTDPTTGQQVARRPGQAGRRYFSDIAYTPGAGGQDVMGQAQLEAMNQAALNRQAELDALGQSLLEQLTASQPAQQQNRPTQVNVGQQAGQGVMGPFITSVSTEDEFYSEPEKKALYDAVVRGDLTLEDIAYATGAPLSRVQEEYDRISSIPPPPVAGISGVYNPLPPTNFAAGGLASLGGKGYYLGGRTDGMADRIPARINNQQPAALSDGEFVVPADVVSHLGNGNSNAGADVLYSMMDRIRKDRTGRKSQGRQINPNKYIPTR